MITKQKKGEVPPTQLTIGQIPVEVRRKNIKNLHVGVYPPEGKVRVSAPLHLDDEAIRLAILSRISWIRRHQQNFLRQARQSAREMVTGESHYYQGQRYRLNVVEKPGRHQVRLINNTTLGIQVKPGTDTAGRWRLLERWYREQMRDQLPDLVGKWEPVVGVEVAECRIKRMKTRWGSCNIGARRVWLNLELIKKPTACLEYILVHEMTHLRERYHNEHFRRLMEQFLPDWQLRRDELNRAPLPHQEWAY